LAESLREHQALMDALLARDPTLSAQRMREHFANGLEAAR
jgi:DNA-binding GntR family transcriptional regulator